MPVIFGVGVLESRKNIITVEAEMKLTITCNSRARELIWK